MKTMKHKDEKQIKEINDLLSDELSKDIFKNRLMFSLTNDYKYIRDIVCSINSINEIYNRMKVISEPIGIFGAGNLGRLIVKTFNNINFECFVDNYKAGMAIENLPVISLKEFIDSYPRSYIIISPKLHNQEIMKQLINAGYSVDKIINFGKKYDELNHLQYFDLPQLKESVYSKEVFIDGGCYDGSSSLDFYNWCKKKSKECHIYAWEPDPENIKNCRNTFENNNIEYTLIPKGLWNETETLSFIVSGTAGSCISTEGNMKIEVSSIDNMINTEVTFIKMDVEGAEYQAIQGARNIIKKYKPRLAICVYHRAEDIWMIPKLIHEINPEYRFYLRHYSIVDGETVLYAI